MSLCECGVIIKNPYDLKRHLNTKSHIRIIYEANEKKRLQENGAYKAKIYKIVNDIDDRIYIGSTKQPLYKRMCEHRTYFKQGIKDCESYSLFDRYGIENCHIYLIEEIEVHTREEQLKTEREWYDRLVNVIVNKRKPFATKEERVERVRLYDKTNIHHLRSIKIKRRKELGKYTCECGSFIDVVEKTRHCKSKKHQDFINHSNVVNLVDVPII